MVVLTAAAEEVLMATAAAAADDDVDPAAAVAAVAPYCRLTPAQIHLTCAGGCQLRWILWQTRQGGAVTNVGEDPVEVLVIRVLAAELLAPRPRPALPVL